MTSLAPPGGTPPLLVGVGHRDRADDGAGPAVVDEVRRRGGCGTEEPRFDTLVREGDLADLALCWDGYDDVTIVDACHTGRPAGSVVAVDPEHIVGGASFSTHGIGLGEAITLAARLGRLPAVIRVVGVEGRHFGWGPLSPEVASAIPTIADGLIETVGAPAPRATSGRASATTP